MADFDYTAGLSDRERLELRLSGLLDGTLSPAERFELEAALADDPSLQVLLADLQDVNATLLRTPNLARFDFAGMTDAVMSVIHAGEAPAPLKLTPAAPAARWNIAQAIRWSGVAAAMLVALGTVGVLLRSGTGPAAADPTRLVDAAVDGNAPSLTVTGPSVPSNPNAAALVPAVASGSDALATADGASSLTVTGPDAAAAKDPTVRTNIPDYASLAAGENAKPEAQKPSVASVADGRAIDGQ